MSSVVSKQISSYTERASWIRKMFETGMQLKQKHGNDAVFDFSIGNPDLPAPPAVAEGLRKVLEKAGEPFAFGYIPNAGSPWAREAVARHVEKEQGVSITKDEIILTCGAAGAINALFRAVLNPGEEVLVPAPFFAEYCFYVENFQGVFKTAPTNPDTFDLDLAAMEAAITPKTKVVLINTPNNPTGQIYSEKTLRELADLLRRKSAEYGRPILLAADEPYRTLAYDHASVPSLLPLYSQTIVLNSFSKSLSMAGERIGYVALSPDMPERQELAAAILMTNRILGFVNLPVIGQSIMVAALESKVNVDIYERRRNLMAKILEDAGYSFVMPKGGFYFFPKAPGGDDIAFIRKLQEELVLGVPGTGFGCPGYFRLAFCVDESVIQNAAEGFKKAIRHFEPAK